MLRHHQIATRLVKQAMMLVSAAQEVANRVQARYWLQGRQCRQAVRQIVSRRWRDRDEIDRPVNSLRSPDFLSISSDVHTPHLMSIKRDPCDGLHSSMLGNDRGQRPQAQNVRPYR